jgi:DNA-binding response OmpR family regulator
MLRHENQHPQTTSLYTVEDLTLNTKSRQVTRNNHLIQLTQREYELLLTLIRHSGETLTRDELLDAVWGVDFEGQPNVVDVYIRYLRNKVDRNYPKQLIHTVRGIGYVLAGNYQE